MKILYLHGYQGSSQSDKAKLLKKWFGEEYVIAPDIIYEKSFVFQSYLELENILTVLQQANENVFVIGSSFGGLRDLRIINPALSHSLLLEHTGIDTSGIENHTRDYDVLTSLDVWLSNDGELLEKQFFEALKNQYPLFRYTHFDDSGHRFTVFKNCRNAVKDLIDLN